MPPAEAGHPHLKFGVGRLKIGVWPAAGASQFGANRPWLSPKFAPPRRPPPKPSCASTATSARSPGQMFCVSRHRREETQGGPPHSHEHDDRDVDGTHGRLRRVPRSQVRPDHDEGCVRQVSAKRAGHEGKERREWLLIQGGLQAAIWSEGLRSSRRGCMSR